MKAVAYTVCVVVVTNVDKAKLKKWLTQTKNTAQVSILHTKKCVDFFIPCVLFSASKFFYVNSVTLPDFLVLLNTLHQRLWWNTDIALHLYSYMRPCALKHRGRCDVKITFWITCSGILNEHVSIFAKY